MGRLANRAKMTTTGGTGTLTLGSAVSGFQTFADAGIADGQVVRYAIEDGSAWEVGTGTYTASGTTLSRTVIESSNADAAINASASAVVFITALAKDFVQDVAATLTGTTPELNTDNGTILSWTLTANSTPTDGLEDGEILLLSVLDGTAYTITWPTMDWIGGSAPALDATNRTVIVLWKQASTLFGSLIGVAS